MASGGTLRSPAPGIIAFWETHAFATRASIGNSDNPERGVSSRRRDPRRQSTGGQSRGSGFNCLARPSPGLSEPGTQFVMSNDYRRSENFFVLIALDGVS